MCRIVPRPAGLYGSPRERVPCGPGSYRAVPRHPSKHGANMGGGRSLRWQIRSVIPPASVAASWARSPAPGTVLKIVTGRTSLVLGRLVRGYARGSRGHGGIELRETCDGPRPELRSPQSVT